MPPHAHIWPDPTLACSSSQLFVGVCAAGYVFNLCNGKRGMHAIPFFRYFATSLSYSDYQLKPSAHTPPQQM